jgi:hypothetical protein
MPDSAVDPVIVRPNGYRASPDLATLGLNEKLLYDGTSQIQQQSLTDNQEDARAWGALKLRQAQNAATIDHLSQIGLLQLGQTGATENQQNTSPAGQAAAEAIKGTIGVSSDAIAASMGNLATSLVPVIASAVATATAQTLASVLPVLVTAIGGASTPSQTQAKPTSGATT